MHICRSALSCCVVSGLPHSILKKYCLPRDIPPSFTDELQFGEVTTLSEHSDEITSDEDEIANFNALVASNIYVIDDDDAGNRDVVNNS